MKINKMDVDGSFVLKGVLLASVIMLFAVSIYYLGTIHYNVLYHVRGLANGELYDQFKFGLDGQDYQVYEYYIFGLPFFLGHCIFSYVIYAVIARRFFGFSLVSRELIGFPKKMVRPKTGNFYFKILIAVYIFYYFYMSFMVFPRSMVLVFLRWRYMLEIDPYLATVIPIIWPVYIIFFVLCML